GAVAFRSVATEAYQRVGVSTENRSIRRHLSQYVLECPLPTSKGESRQQEEQHDCHHGTPETRHDGERRWKPESQADRNGASHEEQRRDECGCFDARLCQSPVARRADAEGGGDGGLPAPHFDSLLFLPHPHVEKPGSDRDDQPLDSTRGVIRGGLAFQV